MRIAFLADLEMENGLYRSLAPMTALAQHRGHAVLALPPDEREPVPLEQLRSVDVLHVHRYYGKRAIEIARTAKEAGAALVWDDDDALETMPKNVGSHRKFSGLAGSQRRAALSWMFRLTDLVTTPSQPLADRLLGYGAPQCEVIENYIPDDFIQQARRRSDDRVVIGWVAGREHKMDVDRLQIRDVLARLLDERPDVHVHTVGVSLGLPSERYHHWKPITLRQLLPEHVAQWDIAIAPISDVEFNRARSNIKLKEYASVGVPWLASPIGPYAGMGEKQGGRLVPDDGWQEALSRLIDKPRERRKLAKHARKWAAGETISKHVDRWESALETAVAHARAAAAS